jgi:hypothetical protein
MCYGMLPLNRGGDKRQACVRGLVPLQTSCKHTPIFELIQKQPIMFNLNHSYGKTQQSPNMNKRSSRDNPETIQTGVKGVIVNCSRPNYGCKGH